MAMRPLIPLLLASLLLLQSGCSTTPHRDEEPAVGGEDAFVIQAEARAAYEEKNYPLAAEKYLLLTRRAPMEVEPWFRLGNIYAHLNRPDDAVAAYREALVRNPKLTKGWHNLGVVHLRQAVNVYGQLCSYAAEGDPLCDQALRVVAGVNRLMEAPSQSEPPPEVTADPGPTEPMPVALAPQEVPPPTEPAATPTAEAPDDARPDLPATGSGAERLMGLPGNHFTIQLLSGDHEATVLRLIGEMGLDGEPMVIHSLDRKGRDLYRAFLGDYPGYGAALAAAQALPAPARRFGPMVRRIGTLQEQLPGDAEAVGR